VGTNTTTRASFGINAIKEGFTSALIYKLQKKNHDSNDQSDVDDTKDTSTSLQLLVAWKVDGYHRYCTDTMLIRHRNTITWDEDKLMKLYSMHYALRRNNRINDTWLLDDGVLMTTLKFGKEEHTIEITISEATKEDNYLEPIWILSST
jgi:hypothetical protein